MELDTDREQHSRARTCLRAIGPLGARLRDSAYDVRCMFVVKP